MIKRLIILSISLLIININYSQSCLPQGIIFSTQHQIDNFQINYPDCNQITGSVTISGGDITNLNGLSILTSIGAHLQIQNNDLLTVLTGLENLISIGGVFYINNDTLLVNLEGLNSLVSVGGTMYIGDNGSLTSLSGLESLNSVGGDLVIRNNPLLTDISSFINLEGEVGALTIEDNPGLVHLTGLNNINHATGSVVIQRNFSLYNMEGLNSLAFIGGAFVIWHNHWLSSFTGLESLDSIGGQFSVQWNHYLTNFEGFDQLQHIGGEVFIWFNFGLVDLSGLESLKSCLEFHIMRDTSLVSLHGVENLEYIGKTITISNNSSLTEISALANLTSTVEFIDIEYNKKLISLDGIDNIVDTSIWHLYIKGNSDLSDCAVASLCHFLSDPSGNIDIEGNDIGCNSVAEILEACETLEADEPPDGGRQSAVRIYPNPSTGIINVELSGNLLLKNTLLSIHNLNGQILLSQNVNEANTVIDVASLPLGFYFVKVMDGRTVSVGKFVKQ